MSLRSTLFTHSTLDRSDDAPFSSWELETTNTMLPPFWLAAFDSSSVLKGTASTDDNLSWITGSKDQYQTTFEASYFGSDVKSACTRLESRRGDIVDLFGYEKLYDDFIQLIADSGNEFVIADMLDVIYHTDESYEKAMAATLDQISFLDKPDTKRRAAGWYSIEDFYSIEERHQPSYLTGVSWGSTTWPPENS